MTTDKIKQKDIYSAMLAHAEECSDILDIPADTLTAFCEKKLEQLAAKKTSSKQTAKQTENKTIAGTIMNVLAAKGRMTVSEMLKDTDILSAVGFNLTSQRITAIVSSQVKAGTLIRTIEKKVPYFSLP